MKKELLVATALVSSFGLIASSAEAATASFSGHARNGAVGKDKDSGANETFGAHQQASFSVSLSETTDGGIVVSTGFDLTDENDGATDVSGLTFTFTDGSKLDIIEAGNAYATHTASVPGASGEQGIGGVTANEAPTGLNFTDTSVATGFEWHSAADFGGVEGLKAGISASIDDDSALFYSYLIDELEHATVIGKGDSVTSEEQARMKKLERYLRMLHEGLKDPKDKKKNKERREKIRVFMPRIRI